MPSILFAGCVAFGSHLATPVIAKPSTGAQTVTSQTARLRTATSPRYGGTLTDTTLGDPSTFNLWVSANSSSSNAVALLFEPLLARDPQTLAWQGRLAPLPTVSRDGRRWTFRLRPNLKWSDGRALTADDIIFTLRAIYDPRSGSSWRDTMLVDVAPPGAPSQLRPIAYRKLDARTVEFRFPRPYAPAREVLSFNIAPRHKLEAAWKAGRFYSAWGVDTPTSELVSSGPWVMSSYQPGQRLTYSRNPRYWRKDARGRTLPYLDHYVSLITSDLGSGQRSFLSGRSDVLGLQGADYTLLKPLENQIDYQVHDLGPSWNYTYLGFNLNPAARIEPRRVRLFQQVQFRRAVSHAIDRDGIVRQLFGGKARALYGPLTPANTVFYNPRTPRYVYNVAAARRLLREAGLRDENKNGLLEWEKQEVRFEIITNLENPLRVAMARRIARDLRAVGLGVTVTPLPFQTLVNRVDAPSHPWEAMLLGFTGGTEPHDGSNIWMSSGNLHLWRPNQPTPATPWEAEIDELFRRGAQTLDQNERREIYNRWQNIVGEQQPMTFLVAPHQLWAVRRRFGNIKPNSLGGVLWNLEEIYDRTATRRSSTSGVSRP